MSFQTRKTFVHLRNINEDILAEFGELSNPPTDRIVITTINVQKRSKEISKIILVSSGVQPSFYTATRILFIHKEITTNKITTLFNNCPPIVPFWRESTEHKQHIRFCVRCTRRISCFRLNQCVTLIVVITLLSMEDKRALRIHQKYLHLCSEDDRRSYGLGTIWGWVINYIIYIFWVNYPFKGLLHPKKTILSLFTYPHVVPTPENLRSSSEHN